MALIYHKYIEFELSLKLCVVSEQLESITIIKLYPSSILHVEKIDLVDIDKYCLNFDR